MTIVQVADDWFEVRRDGTGVIADFGTREAAERFIRSQGYFPRFRDAR